MGAAENLILGTGVLLWEAHMNLLKRSWIVPFVALAASWSQPSPVFCQEQHDPKPKVDLGSFVKEIMVLNMNGEQSELAMWLPYEFFVESSLAQGGIDRATAERQLRLLKPYHTIMIQRSLDRDDGSKLYATLQDVRAGAFLRSENGQEIRPLEKVPPFVSTTVEGIKNNMAAQGGDWGANTQVLIFPVTTKDGKAIVNPFKKDKLTLVLKANGHFKETLVVWHTPFDATNPVPPCRKCKESVSAKWSYCPWCGTGLGRK